MNDTRSDARTLDAIRIGVVGLGQIGGRIAAHLVADGAVVRVFSRSRARLDGWIANHAEAIAADSPAAAADGADFVITCVTNDDALHAVVSGRSGIMAALKPDAGVIDHTTASPAIARSIHVQLTRCGSWFVDAPVSGGPEKAANRNLSIMVGGLAESVRRARPVMTRYGSPLHIGPAGSGQLCKLANQLCLAGTLNGVADAVALIRASGQSAETMLGALSAGSAASWQLEHRAGFMLDDLFPAGFTSDLMYKDLTLATAEARLLGLDPDVAESALRRYRDLIAAGFGSEDFSNVYRIASGQLRRNCSGNAPQ